MRSASLLLLLGMLLSANPAGAQIIIDHRCTDLSKVPDEYVQAAKQQYRLAYGHTSHGSQIVSGMSLLRAQAGSIYTYSTSGDGNALSLHDRMPSGDLGHNGDLAWERATRALLDRTDNDRNMVMWSWCGGCSDNTVEGIQIYLDATDALERDYPQVRFVYMTGHLDGSGAEGNLHQRNEQIRQFCRTRGKVLFDFADIESYDPDGNSFLDRHANDNCDYIGADGQRHNWAQEWCARNPGQCGDCSCAHSQCLNCQQKGKAFWWMMARVAGWEGPGGSTTGDRRILLEEFSSTQCSFCPDGDLTASQIAKDHPSVIWVTHHAGIGVDSMTAPGSETIAGAFVNFAPSGVLDRMLYPKHVAPYDNLGTLCATWDSLITAHLGDEQYCDIRITSTFRGEVAQLDCTVEVTFRTLPPPGAFRLHLFVIEDSIVGAGRGYDQKNYFHRIPGHPYYGAGDPILGYAHHRVVSAIPTGPWGIEGVIPEIPEIGKVYSWNWTGFLSDVWDASNLHDHDIISLVAFVGYHDSDPFKRPVLHAGEAKITNVILGIGDTPPAAEDTRLDVYPSPSSAQVTIALSRPDATGGTLLVSDVTGRLVAQRRLDASRPRITFATASLPAGLYTARLLGPGGVTATHFVVVR